MRKWKLKLQHHDIGAGERLTNIRFADDFLLYATSCGDLVYMIETLIVELACVGVQLNPDKTKIMATIDLMNTCHVEIGGSMVEVLHGAKARKYLGKLLVGNLRWTLETGLAHCLQVARAKFHKHKHVLTNRHVSLKLRFKFFDTVYDKSAF